MDNSNVVHLITDRNNAFSFLCKMEAPNLKVGATFYITTDVKQVTCLKCKLELAKVI